MPNYYYYYSIEVVIGINRSFNMESAATTYVWMGLGLRRASRVRVRAEKGPQG